MDESSEQARLPGYDIERLIRRGGMGVVYLARDKRLNRRVALKLLSPSLSSDPVFRKRFQRESEIAASLDHPNVVPIYEYGEADGVLFIAMRYVEGSDLRTVLEQEGAIRLDRVLAIVRQIAGALDAAHSKGLVHRDVKPANVLLTTTEGLAGVEHVYLTDFGLTRPIRARGGLTGTGQFIGSIDYMAPEQIEKKDFDHRVDVYALGCLTYECLSGTVPFPKETDAAVLVAHLQEDVPSLTATRPDLSFSIEAVVRKAMAKDADDRFSSCGAFVRKLEENVTSSLARPGDLVVPEVETSNARSGQPTRLRQRRTGGAQMAARSVPTKPWFKRRAIAIVVVPIAALIGLALWRLVDGRAPAKTGRLESILGDPRTRLAYEIPANGGFKILTSSSGRTDPVVQTTIERPGQVAISSDLKEVAIAREGSVVVKSQTTDEVVRKITTNEQVADLEFGPGGTLAAVFQSVGTRGTVSRIMTTSAATPHWIERAKVRGFASGLDWSSTGDSLALSATAPGAKQHLLIVDVSSGATRVLHTGTPVAEDPAWSPDDTLLALSGGGGASLDILVVRAPGASSAGAAAATPSDLEPRKVTTDAADESDPTWSLDGKFLAFIKASGGNAAIYVSPVEGGHASRLDSVKPRTCCLEWVTAGR